MKISNDALSESNEVKSFYGIDIVKFICAILVVSIHIAPFGSNEKLSFLNYWVQNYLARVAVPFFFVTSGFFLFRKTRYDSFDIHVPIQYAKKLFRLYVIWTVIYGPFILKEILTDENGVIHGIIRFVRKFIFTGSYFVLWFYSASNFG
ncbi:acyltransferase family protein, partial [Anaerosporobacter sp.]